MGLIDSISAEQQRKASEDAVDAKLKKLQQHMKSRRNSERSPQTPDRNSQQDIESPALKHNTSLSSHDFSDYKATPLRPKPAEQAKLENQPEPAEEIEIKESPEKPKVEDQFVEESSKDPSLSERHIFRQM